MPKKQYEFEQIAQSIKEVHRRSNQLKNAMSDDEIHALIKKEVANRDLRKQ